MNCKTVYDELAEEVNSNAIKVPSTSGLVSKYNSDKENLGKKIKDNNKKIPNIVNELKRLITKQKLQRLKTRYFGVTGLVTTTAFNKKAT